MDDMQVISRYSRCPKCGAEVKVCLNCRFYDPSAHWECREDIPEEVPVKDRSNFCEYFQLRKDDTPGVTAQENPAEQNKARRKFDQLFGNE